MRNFMLLPFLLLVQISFAQSLDFQTFSQALEAFGIEADQPTEARAKYFIPKKQTVLKEDFRINLKKERMEIWVAFRPADTSNYATQMPNVYCRTTAVNAATNAEGTVTTVLRLSDAYLREIYGADWGRELYFRPKKKISEREHCRLISIYKSEVGHLNVFCFFDEKSKSVDAFSELFRFNTEEEGH